MNSTPTWMIVMLTIFGLAAGAGVIGNHYYTAKLNATEQSHYQLSQELLELRLRHGNLTKLEDTLTPELSGRRDQLDSIAAISTEKREIVIPALLSRQRDVLAQNENELTEQANARTNVIEQLKRAQTDLANIERETLNNERQLAEDLNQRREGIEQLSLEIEQERRNQRDNLLALEAEVTLREARVRELLDRQDTNVETLGVDGSVLQSRASEGFVIVDRGRSHDLRQGTRFAVWQRRGGSSWIKGWIEVIEVQARMSVARVMEEVDLNDPIVPGDFIHNHTYNPDEVKIYVIAGDFDHYSPEELAYFVEESGGQVDPEVSTKTHYLIAGRNATKALADADRNGVTVVSELQLVQDLRNPLRVDVRSGMIFAIAGKLTTVAEPVVREFIQANGGKVSGSITPDVHVVIVGEEADKDLAKASSYGATIINQRQLIHLMGRNQ